MPYIEKTYQGVDCFLIPFKTVNPLLGEKVKKQLEIKIKSDIVAYVSKHYKRFVKKFKQSKVCIVDSDFSGQITTKGFKIIRFSFSERELSCMLQTNTYNDFFQYTILHEILHGIAYLKMKPDNDGDKYFERLLKRKHSSTSGETKKGLRKANLVFTPFYFYQYKCTCQFKYSTQDTLKHPCKKCHAPYELYQTHILWDKQLLKI